MDPSQSSSPSSSEADADATNDRSFLQGVGECLDRLLGAGLIFLVRVYQWTLSPIMGRQCRFHPTCSHYFIGAVRKYGAVRGSAKGLWRICRCNPWGGQGDDPP